MNFEWEQYICLACKLIKSPEFTLFYDASLRTAMSRSYYGVYGVASTYALNHGVISLPSIDPHKFVREWFKSRSNHKEIQVGERMGRLWRGRKEADYGDVYDIEQANAEQNLTVAIETIRDLKIVSRSRTH